DSQFPKDLLKFTRFMWLSMYFLCVIRKSYISSSTGEMATNLLLQPGTGQGESQGHRKYRQKPLAQPPPVPHKPDLGTLRS
uniref:Uncharacterized protein n=1 Tax=Calidris pygmaea TaxID=425635 RepID=A0A8C3K155_9CHAR